MTQFAVLDTEEYRNILTLALNITIILRPGQRGIFAFDIKSSLMFEFSCVADAKKVDNGCFLIYGVDKYYVNKKEGGYIEVEIDPRIDAIQFWQTQLTDRKQF